MEIGKRDLKVPQSFFFPEVTQGLTDLLEQPYCTAVCKWQCSEKLRVTKRVKDAK